MPNFNVFIATLEASNPGMRGDENKITLTVAALKKLLLKAHNNGYQDRIAVEAACKPVSGKDKLDELMRKFGGFTK
jgi:hypothetical protein